MSKFGVMVMGPAGAGKTTFCSALITHLQLNRRSCFYVNLDPAAETFDYPPDLDIKELISLHDAMSEVGLGPNGGLMYCFDFLMDNPDFLTEALDGLTDEYLVVFDMPGQIELYTHAPALPALVRFLTQPGNLDMRLCAVYLLEAAFVLDRAKFFAGTLSAMSAMLMLEVPHLNVLSKADLLPGHVRSRDLDRFLAADPDLLDDDPVDRVRGVAPLPSGPWSDDLDPGVDSTWPPASTDPPPPSNRTAVVRGDSFRRLNRAVASLIDSFGMVNYLQLNAADEDSVGGILSYVDNCIQYHEAQDPREPRDEDVDM